MTGKTKAVLITVCVLVLFGAGYGVATWRHKAWLAGYSEREQKRMEQVAVGEAEQKKLRAENEATRKESEGLRQEIAKLSADDEAKAAIIESRGGVIAAEAKNLEKINEELKTDQAVISNPTDRCVRCRRFSERAVANGQIGKPLTCKDECAGAH
jgi:cell division protein FtsB